MPQLDTALEQLQPCAEVMNILAHCKGTYVYVQGNIGSFNLTAALGIPVLPYICQGCHLLYSTLYLWIVSVRRGLLSLFQKLGFYYCVKKYIDL